MNKYIVSLTLFVCFCSFTSATEPAEIDRIRGLDAALQKGGLNVCLLSPQGQILSKENFNPLLHKEDNKRAAEYLSSFPPGTILLLAVRDDYSMMDENVIQALSDYGFSQYPRNLFRYSFAGIGVKGTQPGSALEKMGYESLEIFKGRKIFPPRLIHFTCSEN